MAKSSLQSLFFWDCFTSLLMAYLLAETYVELDISFESYHDEDVGYKVVIINQRDNPACIETMANELKTEYLEPFPFNRSRINHTLTIERSTLLNYDVSSICVRVTPFKKNCSDCSNFTQIIPYIKINAYGDPDCADWNIQCLDRLQEYNEFGQDLLVQCVPPEPLVRASKQQTCGQSIAIDLFVLENNFDTCSFGETSLFVKFNTTTVSLENSKVLFTKLTPGYYCYHVRPLRCKTDCAHYSEVINLQKFDPLRDPKVQPSNIGQSRQTSYIMGAIISVTVVVGLIIGLFLRQLKKRRLEATPTWEFKPIDSPHDVSIENPPQKVREVTILYTQESPEILNCIVALVQFIRKCCDVIVRIDIDDETAVRMNPVAWYGRGDLFILIETAGAVYREKACLDKKEIYHIDEDSLDSYFLHSFMRIINNPDSVIDYSKYVVVRFSYTPKNVTFKTVALNKRYVISQHLAQLCHFLTHGKDLTPTTENLLKFVKKWEGTSHFQNLSLAIEQASSFVNQNPNYVQSVLKER